MDPEQKTSKRNERIRALNNIPHPRPCSLLNDQLPAVTDAIRTALSARIVHLGYQGRVHCVLFRATEARYPSQP